LRTTKCSITDQMLDVLNQTSTCYDQLVTLADYASSTVYSTSSEHQNCNQLSAVIRKYPFSKDQVTFDPRKKALETFLRSERKCELVNRKFRLFDILRSPDEGALNRARSWISYVLGDLSLADVWADSSFGPGASIGVHGSATNMARKFLASKWSVSPGAFYYARAACRTDDHFREYLLREPGHQFYSSDDELFNKKFAMKTRFVEHNNITFVPKTVKTERTIAVEPLLNGYLQKGLDMVMRKRLKRVGLDLSDQTLNQGLALFGSLRDEVDPYVTIDLSSASDSISIGLCRNLLPPDWFDFMNSIRSKSYLLDGKVKPYHKFVTMGNGFCFPLETLIFASLCNVAYQELNRPADYSVYGDDIIVRSSVARRVLDLLRICGFKSNTEKTFLSGPFRESCGADWFEGKDVRPITLDYEFDSVENIFKFCNIVRSKEAWQGFFSEACEFLITLIPPELMFTRPYKGNVDTALEVPLDVFLTSPFSRFNRSLFCWSWLEIRKSAKSDVAISHVPGYDLALMRGALTGALSSTPFAERRKTCTKVCRISYGGGYSLWSPRDAFARTSEVPRL